VRHIEAGELPKASPEWATRTKGRLYSTRGASCAPWRTCLPRRTRSPISTPMSGCAVAAGHVHQQPGVPLQLRILHQRGRLRRKWNALEPEQVSQELCDLAARYRLQLIWVVDDNFLVDRNRALGIAEGICARGTRLNGASRASTNLVTRPERGGMETNAPRRPHASSARRGLRLAEGSAPDEQGLPEAGHDLRRCGPALSGRRPSLLQHESSGIRAKAGRSGASPFNSS